MRRFAAWAMVAVALLAVGCQATGLAPSAPPSGPAGCSLRLVPSGDGPGASLRGEGFGSDAAVVLDIETGGAHITRTEADDPALRTDVRGVFITYLEPERANIGPFGIRATAGGCSARVSGSVDASLFPAACVTSPPAPTGGPKADAYRELVAADDPIGWWRFEDPNGGTTSADAGRDAVLVGEPGLAQPGAMAGSRSIGLDGSAWVDIDDIVLDADFTIEAWLYLCGEMVDHRDAVVGQAGEGPDVNLAEGRIRLWDGAADRAISDVPIGHGRWVHVAVVREEVALRLVQDGSIVGTGLYEPAFPVAAIGWGNAGRLEGRIDEVAIYERALPPDRLAARLDAAR